MAEDAYCTLLLNDGYLHGAQVLAHSLRDGGTTKKLAVLIVEGLQPDTIGVLEDLYDYIIPVERTQGHSQENLLLLNRMDLNDTFTKIHLWRQTQFRKIVYIDADVLVLRPPDELFDREVEFAACPDVGWPDCFNSGVMLLKPDIGKFNSLSGLAQQGVSFDGADQGLLNQFFPKWDRLSFAYNCTPSSSYQYVPAYRHFQSQVSMVHFIGAQKPWNRSRGESSPSNPYGQLLGRWWAVWDRHYIPKPKKQLEKVPEEGPAPDSTHQAIPSIEDYPVETLSKWFWEKLNSTPGASIQNAEQINQRSLTKVAQSYRPEVRYQGDPQGTSPRQIIPNRSYAPVTGSLDVSRFNHLALSSPFNAASSLGPSSFQSSDSKGPLPGQFEAVLIQNPPLRSDQPQSESEQKIYFPVPSMPLHPTSLGIGANSQDRIQCYDDPHLEDHHHSWAEQHYQLPLYYQIEPPPPTPPCRQYEFTVAGVTYVPISLIKQQPPNGIAKAFPLELTRRNEAVPNTYLPPFNAPQHDWDPTKSAPPQNSAPEALGFPQMTYRNQWDSITPPVVKQVPHPAPPATEKLIGGNEMPPNASAGPSNTALKPIFPWEERAKAPPTRVFSPDNTTVLKHHTGHSISSRDQGERDSDEHRSSSEETLESEEELEEELEEVPVYNEVEYEEERVQWRDYVHGNQWDAIPGISKYVSALKRRHALFKADKSTMEQDGIIRSGTYSDDEEGNVSLPVTPNPLRRRTIWGRTPGYIDEESFPSAPGVPPPGQWDPHAKLNELRTIPKSFLARQGRGGTRLQHGQQWYNPRESPRSENTSRYTPLYSSCGTQTDAVQKSDQSTQWEKSDWEAHVGTQTLDSDVGVIMVV